MSTRKNHKTAPSISPELIAEVATEREKSRMAVFERAWEMAVTEEQKVTLAVAYLGGTGK